VARKSGREVAAKRKDAVGEACVSLRGSCCVAMPGALCVGANSLSSVGALAIGITAG
jgi:hypothetical protein